MRSLQAGVRSTLPGMQVLLLIAGGLVFISGVQLFVLSEATDRFFAWTVNPPLTAAFLGGAYWASCVLEVAAARTRTWANARIAVPAVLLFTAITLGVTLLHIDRFHFTSAEPTARAAAWAWLIVYAAVPVLLGGALLLQRRAPGGNPSRQRPLPAWVRLVLTGHALIMVPLGLGLVLAPQATIGLWPWELTPLTGRAIGAWSLALGVAAAHAAWENDWSRVRVATAGYVAFGGLELIALMRYSTSVDWRQPPAWILVAFLLSVLGLGLYGWWASSTRAEQPAGAREV